MVEGWGTKYEILRRYLNKDGTLRERLMTKVSSKYFEKIEIVSFRGHDFIKSVDFLKALYGNYDTS